MTHMFLPGQADSPAVRLRRSSGQDGGTLARGEGGSLRGFKQVET